MQDLLTRLRDTFVGTWHSGSSVRGLSWRSSSRGDQDAGERRLTALVDLLTSEAEHARHHGALAFGVEGRVREGFLVFADSALGWRRSRLEPLIEEFGAAMETFRLEARRFDPALSAADIYQAARNAITMLCLQRLLGRPVGVTPSMVGYSLLYPYTDNFLDDPSVNAEAKAAFVRWFGARLAGGAVEPSGRLEVRVSDLVAMIEQQYPRPDHPQVFDALLAIHAAQVRSVALLTRPSPGEVVEIAVEKGGTSVLADGYLVDSRLTPAQAECLYGLGVFLQLRDDLEDRADDRRRGQATPFSTQPWYRRLDGPTARALSVGQAVVDRLGAFDASAAGPVCELMRDTLLLTITDAAAVARRRYSRRFRRELEAHSPFSLARLVKERRRLTRAHGSVSGLLETWLAASEVQRPGRASKHNAQCAMQNVPAPLALRIEH
jgi:hypothetical protein